MLSFVVYSEECSFLLCQPLSLRITTEIFNKKVCYYSVYFVTKRKCLECFEGFRFGFRRFNSDAFILLFILFFFHAVYIRYVGTTRKETLPQSLIEWNKFNRFRKFFLYISTRNQ